MSEEQLEDLQNALRLISDVGRSEHRKLVDHLNGRCIIDPLSDDAKRIAENLSRFESIEASLKEILGSEWTARTLKAQGITGE